MDRDRSCSSGGTRDQSSEAVAAQAGGQARCRIPTGAVVRGNLVTEWHPNYALSTRRAGNGAVNIGQVDRGRGGTEAVSSFHTDSGRPGSSRGARDQTRGAVTAQAGGQTRGRIPIGAVVCGNLVTERRADHALSAGRTRDGAVNIGEIDGGRGGREAVSRLH